MYAARYFPKRYFAGRYFPPVVSGGFAGWLETTDGGISFSGGAAFSHSYVEPTSGGLVFASDAAISNTYVEPTDGGISFAGQAGVSYIDAGQVDAIRRWYRLGTGF